ncbi:MAG: asparagine synthase (glutamine-hydrolyzing) [Planctomycetaceae bacterium]|nr:asparagine synthase (glutamine-hydrolyzing) [Planctomycetaceae bacterium]
MCGIAGQLGIHGRPVSQNVIARMTAQLTHRGPDGDGLHVDGCIGLGHRRLSIIDLEAGKQPLCNEDGSIWITFNGEIYNYRELRERLIGLGHQFRTHSDTETIVHAYEQWGTDCLQLLRGMFAFAIWDGPLQQLLLARDRLGIKPLVYCHTAESVSFASELQALRVLPDFPDRIDLAAVDAFLHYQYIPAPHTIYADVRKLEPAHFLVIRCDGTTTGPQRYWKLTFNPDNSLTDLQWEERLTEALREAVATHLVSDVPFGAFLSGGIDSSLVVSAMSELLDQPVQAFCIGHPREDFDERRWARHAVETCRAEFIDQVIDEDALSLVPDLVRHYGEPFADSSALPTYFVSRLASHHVKMVLSGDGGDELFAGYHAYPAILWEHRPHPSLYRRSKKQLADLARTVGLWPANTSPEDSKYRRTTPLDPVQRGDLWRPEHRDLFAKTRAEFHDRFAAAHQPHLLNTLQAFDVENFIPYDNLSKVDIASMFHGLEVRVPLLDHQFVETCARVPLHLKLSPLDSAGYPTQPPAETTGKWLLKRLARKRFGEDFVDRPK